MGRTVTNSIPPSFRGFLVSTNPLHVLYFLRGTFLGRIFSLGIDKVFVPDAHTRQEAQEVSIMGVSLNACYGMGTCLKLMCAHRNIHILEQLTHVWFSNDP